MAAFRFCLAWPHVPVCREGSVMYLLTLYGRSLGEFSMISNSYVAHGMAIDPVTVSFRQIARGRMTPESTVIFAHVDITRNFASKRKRIFDEYFLFRCVSATFEIRSFYTLIIDSSVEYGKLHRTLR